MALSGTYNFNLDIMDICEEAYERCGLELRTGYDLTTARRSLDLLLTEWANDQVTLWTLEQTTLPLVASQADYTISDPTIGILDAVVRITSTVDQPLERISLEEYLMRPDKTSEGRPTHYRVQRHETSLTVSMWPVPDVSTYNFVYYALRYTQDAGAYTNNAEIPRRFLPALIAGLSHKIAQKNPAKMARNEQTGQFEQVGGVAANVRQELYQEYLTSYEKAKGEDRDRSSFYVVPRFRV